MTEDSYRLSFTTGGLFLEESPKVAEMYLRSRSWEQVTKDSLSQNLLQTRTVASAKRRIREIISRLKNLNGDELELLAEGNREDQAALLWVAVCRSYRFIREFSIEVMRESFLSMKPKLQYEDFDNFLHRKAEFHPELDEITESTRKKLRQVLFRILEEASLVTSDGELRRASLSPLLISELKDRRKSDLLCFPLWESDLAI